MNSHFYDVARRLTAEALRKGRLIPQPCEVCGNEKAIAHHDDYRYPMEVRWLCRKHHVMWHRKNGYGAYRFPAERDWASTYGQILMLGDIVVIGRKRWKVDQSITIGNEQKIRLAPA